MVIANPAKVPGSELRAYRDLYGVSRPRLGRQIGKHRNTLASWEESPEIDATRAEEYRRGVDALVAARLGKAS